MDLPIPNYSFTSNGQNGFLPVLWTSKWILFENLFGVPLEHSLFDRFPAGLLDILDTSLPDTSVGRILLEICNSPPSPILVATYGDFSVLDQRDGIFTSTYTVFPHWAPFLIRSHVQFNDLDKNDIVNSSKWFALSVLSYPYKIFMCPPRRPPDGCILSLVVLIYVVTICCLSITFSCCKIIGIKLRLNSPPQSVPEGERDYSQSDATQPECYVFTSIHVLTSQDLENRKVFTSFDSNAQTALVDNCANTHIWNDKSQFINYREIPKSKQGVSTIGGNPHYAEGIGDVPTSWRDDDGKIFRHTLKNVLYFSNSPVRIISCVRLSDEWDNGEDLEGTYIKTKKLYSIFKWKYKSFKRTIQHPHHCLPEMAVNEGYSNFEKFCNYCYSLSDVFHNEHFSFYSAFATNSIPAPEDPFAIGDKLCYSKDGLTSLCHVLETPNVLDDEKVYKVKLTCGRVLSVPIEFLQNSDDPDIACIPHDKRGYVRELPRLSDEDLQHLTNPSALSDDDKEWLARHNQLNHMSRNDMYKLTLTGVLPKKFMKYRSKTPFCASCAFGRAHRKQWRSKGQEVHPIRRILDDKPGARVSVDQMVSAQPGLVPQLSGYLSRSRIHCATLFIDHYTSMAYSFLQTSTSQDETLNVKASFEKMANQYNVEIKSYHADNGRFSEARFRDDCEKNDQSISFCAVGAHHQNGIVESHIKNFTLQARTCLLHAKRLWPEAITTMLWPFALQYCVESHNKFHLDKDRRSPMMKFSGVDEIPDIGDFHPFGCPVFVLEPKLQGNNKAIPKWDPRARLGVFLGHSPVHANSVALVLNPATGHVSPQYHVVFDDNFTTVSHLRAGTVPINWSNLVENSSYSSTEEKYNLSDTWFQEHSKDPDDPDSAPPMVNGQALQGHESTPSSEGGTLQPSEGGIMPPSEGDQTGLLPSEGEGVPISNLSEPFDFSSENGERSPAIQDCEGDGIVPRPRYINLEHAGLRHSKRDRTVHPKVKESYDSTTKRMHSSFFAKLQFVGLTAVCGILAGTTALCSDLHQAHLTNYMTSLSGPFETSSQPSVFQSSLDSYHYLNSHFDCTLNVLSTFALASVNASNDTYAFREMLQQPDKGKFMEAMTKEVDDHVERVHWTIIPRSSMPKGMKTILAVWSFKRKRLPDGTITKWKARLCCHGGMQQWGAFPQADVDVPVYMELPVVIDLEGADKRSFVLKLNKQASLTWFEMLSKGLVDRGFTPSMIDPCVFIRSNCIVLVYVDDCIVISPDTTVIDNFVRSMQRGHENFSLTDDGDLARFLGVEMKHNENGSIEMSQMHLIQRIIEACNIDRNEVNARETPVGKPLLHKDLSGEKRKHDWNYRSVVGMLNYLASSTRPELAMAVHQCARFNNSPMLSHERAITRICRYLLHTSDKGMIYKPDRSLGLQCYVDADFAGGWNQLDADNAENLYSRSGYVIMFAGCPILWSSKLQSEITLSTTEAEYVALSQAMREVIPLMDLMKELNCVLKVNTSKPDFFCQVFEDNRGTITVATSKKYTPRTKHIALKYHHFRQ